MKYEFAVLALWAIAIAVTLFVLPAGRTTTVAPVYAVCMIGSIVVVRAARKKGA